MLKRAPGRGGAPRADRQLPNWLVRLAALLDPAVRQILPELGKLKNATSEKARRVLGWAPRSNEEAIVATAESLVRLGLLERARERQLRCRCCAAGVATGYSDDPRLSKFIEFSSQKITLKVAPDVSLSGKGPLLHTRRGLWILFIPNHERRRSSPSEGTC